MYAHMMSVPCHRSSSDTRSVSTPDRFGTGSKPTTRLGDDKISTEAPSATKRARGYHLHSPQTLPYLASLGRALPLPTTVRPCRVSPSLRATPTHQSRRASTPHLGRARMGLQLAHGSELQLAGRLLGHHWTPRPKTPERTHNRLLDSRRLRTLATQTVRASSG